MKTLCCVFDDHEDCGLADCSCECHTRVVWVALTRKDPTFAEAGPSNGETLPSDYTENIIEQETTKRT